MKCTIRWLLACSLLGHPVVFPVAAAAEEEVATFYPAYGYRQGDRWVMPMRVWVHERRGLAEGVVARVAASMGRLASAELDNFRARIRDFVADSESGEAVVFVFDGDPERERFRVRDEAGGFPKTDRNGLVEGTVTLPQAKADALLRHQGSANGWLTFRAVSKEHSGVGRVRLIDPEGLSVISDIDDTVKITEIRAGSKVVVRNTFFRDFQPAPDMPTLYRGFEGAAFHYVSGGPWQLQGPLSEFLFGERGGFPEGTFHMKNVRKNLLSPNTWEDLVQLVTNENLTFEQKVSQISQIMERFPGRRFILVGDSGEKDPEVYRAIKARFGAQVREIRIRDVVNDRENDPARLDGMTIIPALTVTRGVSQFGG